MAGRDQNSELSVMIKPDAYESASSPDLFSDMIGIRAVIDIKRFQYPSADRGRRVIENATNEGGIAVFPGASHVEQSASATQRKNLLEETSAGFGR